MSQSSPVIRYILTSPLTSLAMAGVTLVPGDKEYTMGRPSSRRTYNDMSYDKFANESVHNITNVSVRMRMRTRGEEAELQNTSDT